MNCRCASSRISAYLDGELTGAETLPLREHLRQCPTCAQELEALRRLKVHMSALAAPPPPADLPSKLAARIAQIDESARPRYSWSGRMALAAVAAVAIALAVVAHRTIQPADPKFVKQTSPFEVADDQAFVAGADPLSGQAPVLTVGR